MDPDLSVTVQRMYDFIVAYENLLRDGQESIDCSVEIAGIPVSYDGQPNGVWCFGKKDNKYRIYHFINLCGTDHEWRDTDQNKKEPSELKDLITSIRIPNAVQKVWLVSPDREDISPQSIPFDLTAEGDGYFLQFKMPSLSYWNMVFMR
jgi:dextranase